MKQSAAITKEINAKNENQILTKVIASGHQLNLSSLKATGKEGVKQMRRTQRTKKRSAIEKLIDIEKRREEGEKISKNGLAKKA